MVVASSNSLLQRGHVMHDTRASLLTLTNWVVDVFAISSTPHSLQRRLSRVHAARVSRRACKPHSSNAGIYQHGSVLTCMRREEMDFGGDFRRWGWIFGEKQRGFCWIGTRKSLDQSARRSMLGIWRLIRRKSTNRAALLNFSLLCGN